MAFQTTQRPAFGRRVNPQAQPVTAARPARIVEPVAAPPVVSEAQTAVPPEEISVDQELQAWKAARGSRFVMPWRQIYLMASLCFGIASFVLPDSVNDNVDYLLWALCGLSALAWYTGRRKKKADAATAQSPSSAPV